MSFVVLIKLQPVGFFIISHLILEVMTSLQVWDYRPSTVMVAKTRHFLKIWTWAWILVPTVWRMVSGSFASDLAQLEKSTKWPNALNYSNLKTKSLVLTNLTASKAYLEHLTCEPRVDLEVTWTFMPAWQLVSTWWTMSRQWVILSLVLENIISVL